MASLPRVRRLGRRWAAPAIALFLMAGTAAVQSAPSLTAHWGLNETAGPTSIDSAGANDGSWNGAPTTTPAVSGAVASWSTAALCVTRGGQNYIEMPNTAVLENIQESDYTIMGWFNPASSPPTDNGAGEPNENEGLYGIVYKRGHHEGLGYLDTQQFTFGKWVTDTNAANTTVWAGVSSGGTYAPSQWYHIAGVANFAAQTTTLYVNGVQDGIRAWPTHTTPYREYDQRPWRIGIANPIGGYNSWEAQADGCIDDVRLYDRALSASEIASAAAGSDPGAFVPSGPGPGPGPAGPASTREGSEESCGCGTISPLGPGSAAVLAALLALAAAAFPKVIRQRRT